GVERDIGVMSSVRGEPELRNTLEPWTNSLAVHVQQGGVVLSLNCCAHAIADGRGQGVRTQALKSIGIGLLVSEDEEAHIVGHGRIHNLRGVSRELYILDPLILGWLPPINY